SPEIKKQLLALQQNGININQLLEEFLQKREQELEEEKEGLAQEEAKKSEKRQREGKKPSRYIPVKVKRVLQAEHGTNCSIYNCDKPSKEIHHAQRFALSKTHNPRYMAPLCRQHHEIAGAIDVKALHHKWLAGK